jgi:uncharacterized protein DUF6448
MNASIAYAARVLLLLAGLGMTLLATRPAFGHCDTLDGPVVTLAKRALEAGDVNLVLPWVPKADEPEIRRAFSHAVSVRKLGPEARQLADTFFFETLVRVHRASEGAPYTGLKPAGLDLGPAIPAADKALNTGSTQALEKLLGDVLHKGLRDHFDAARRRMNSDPGDVEAGREYVQAYVAYVHYVEALYAAATTTAHGHYGEPAAATKTTLHAD